MENDVENEQAVGPVSEAINSKIVKERIETTFIKYQRTVFLLKKQVKCGIVSVSL